MNEGVQELEERINEMHATMEATQEQANQGIKLLCRWACCPITCCLLLALVHWQYAR